MALNALHTALGHLGFTNAAAVFTTDQQGLDSLDEFCPLMDDEVENLIEATCHPGGTILKTQPCSGWCHSSPTNPKSQDTSLSTCRKQLAINVLPSSAQGMNLKNHNVTNNYSSLSMYLT